jgi:hypothetical protein
VKYGRKGLRQLTLIGKGDLQHFGDRVEVSALPNPSPGAGGESVWLFITVPQLPRAGLRSHASTPSIQFR